MLCEAFWSTREPIPGANHLSAAAGGRCRPARRSRPLDPDPHPRGIRPAGCPARGRGRSSPVPFSWPSPRWSCRSGTPDDDSRRPAGASVRSRIRALVAEAWARCHRDPARCRRRGGPAAGHRDRAALQPRPRRPRGQPGHEAGAPDAPLAAADRRGTGGGVCADVPAVRALSRRRGRHARASSTCASRPRGWRACSTRRGLRATSFGRVEPGASTAPQRRVRLGQSYRPAARRQRSRCLRRRPPDRGSSRAADTPSHARVLLQRLRRPDPQPRGLGRRPASWARSCPRTAIAAHTSTSSPRSCPTRSGRRRPRPARTADGIVADWAQERVRAGIEESLERLGVHFDVWKSEASLHREGWVGRSVEKLREGGHIYEQDGATWFRSTTFGDDKDRVVYRSGGQPTYFASDIGYVTEKFSRGFDKLIYIWGADHHGTVARVRNAAEAMGLDKDAVEMLLVAWVRFVRDGVEVPMSKRSGEFLTLDELLEEIGVDAARWSFASRSASSPIDVDIELAKKQSSENPVYYVQYAHARISSILAKAASAGLTPADRLQRRARGRRGRHRPGPRGAATARGRRGWRRLGRDARRHRLRHGAGHDLPRLLPRPPCHRPRRPGDLGRPPGARRA